MHHVKLKRNSRFTSGKRCLSRHHAMHHFHTITSIMLLLHESRPEEKANHAITPCITFTPSRQLFFCFTNHAFKKMANHAITSTAGGTSKYCYFFQTKSYDFSLRHLDYDLKLTITSFDQFSKISYIGRVKGIIILCVYSK